MYFVKYGYDYLHDPRADLLLTSTKLEVEVNAAGSFDFKIYSGHPLFDTIKERDTANPVTVYQDDALIFCGDILSIESDFHLGKKVVCRGELGWLNDSLVRPYSTLSEECDNVAPASVDGYFEWLIENHNSQVEATKRFKVGKNEGSLLDDNNYIYRSDSGYPNTGTVIKEKLLESLGGYVQVRHEDGCRYIDLLTDFPKVNAQIIDFGVNLLDYVKTDTTDDMATFIIPVGKELEEEDTEKVKQRLTLSSLGDGYISGDYFKSGDIVYSDSAVKERGWIGALVEFSDVTEAENLRDKAVLALKGLISPVRTVEVTAIDLAMIDPEYEPIFIGQYVRARSKPHRFDSYLLCSKIEFDLNQPDNDKFTLGTTFDVLTGVQNKRINALNATINTVYEAADQISAEAKAAAVLANQAQASAGEAKEAASAAQTKADEAKEKADEAATAVGEATTAANDAKAEASKAYQSAIDADAKALAAQEAVDKVETIVTDMQTDVSNAQSKAEAAQQAASQADSKAVEAQQAAQSATDTANAAQTAAGEAKTAAFDASTTAAAAKLDAEQANKDIAALGEELETVSNTMTADYARKTDLTEATASLQSQISQNAGEIASTVSRLETVDETANDAADKAEAAQSAASTAQSKADEATADAAAAQTKADQAAAAAATAQSNADSANAAAAAAQAKADEAADNLATAEQNLAEVTSRVGSTEEDIAAAQKAVTDAQAAADAAQADATEAAEKAANAQATASNAATAASNAKNAADAAQADADAAKTAADKAQADVDSLEVRVASAETKITQNTEAIELRATKTEVTQTLGGYYTKAETEAKITETAESITQTVSETYTTKEDFNNLEVGGRNLAINGGSSYEANGLTIEVSGYDYHIYGTNTNTSANYGLSHWAARPDILEPGKLYTVSTTEPLPAGLYVAVNSQDENGASIAAAAGSSLYGDGARKSLTFTCAANSNGHLHGFFGVLKSCGTVDVTFRVKIEKGNKATDWTAPPEDIEGEVTQAFSEITQLANSIQNLVVGKDGTSLMTQTDTGWTFNVGNMEETLETTSTALESLQEAVGEWDEAGTMASNIAALISIVNSHGTTLDWVNIGTFTDDDGDELPCIELGESDSDYKLLITNKAIFFKEGSTAPTKIQDNTLVTNNVEVKHELKQGNWVWSARSNGNLGLSWKEV